MFRYSGDRVVETMVISAEEQIEKKCYLAKGSGRIFKIYAKEVAGIVEDWGSNGFAEKEIDIVLKKITYLTATMKKRLSPIA